MDYIEDDVYMTSRTVQDSVDASISGTPFSTWAGPLTAALSGEWRSQSFQTRPNATAADMADCASLGYASANCKTGVTGAYVATFANLDKVSQSVGEVAVEFNAPLLADKPLAQSLNLNGALRYTSYSTSGNYTTWKLGVDWHLNDELRFRATDSQDIRAPTLYDLFQPAVTVPLNNYVDPLTGHTLPSVPSINEGNPDLTAELRPTIRRWIHRNGSLWGAVTLSGHLVRGGLQLSRVQTCEAGPRRTRR